MRIYEYAKLHGIPSKEVISFLQDQGFDIKSHMAVISPDALAALDKMLDTLTASSLQEPSLSEPELIPESKVMHNSLKNSSEKKQPIPSAQPAVSQKLEASPELKEVKKEVKSEKLERTQLVKPQAVSEPSGSIVRKEGIELTPMTVADFATVAKKPVSEIILTLLRQGVAAVKNQVISEKVVAQLAKLYNIAIYQPAQEEAEANPVRLEVKGKKIEERLPVIVVVGHVDHGKTTLLDFIRKTRVAAKEKGGITQHLGAYEVHTPHGDAVFLDTPGHEAFSKMRERGTRVADIAVLVVAADDGIMPQSAEAIRQAQAAKIPLVVAINKIDKVAPGQQEVVLQGLAKHGLVPEAWGGQTVCVPVSAKFGTGVDELLEVLVLQSKLMELTASLDVPARGYVLEAKQEKGRGSVATVICQHGILHVGDYFVTGGKTGKVTSLIDSWGKRVQSVHPSYPVQVAGFDDLPQAGELFEVIPVQEFKKLRNTSQVKAPAASSASRSTAHHEQAINIILKADNDSSRQALLDALEKINQKAYRPLHVIQAGIGAVSESDVQLAQDTQALIYTLHTKSDTAALSLAVKYGVAIKHFDIIYKFLEDLEQVSQEGKPVKKVLKKVGEATVLKVFPIKGVGTIAGAHVKSGKLIKDAPATVWRGKYKVGEGTIKSLQREKKPIKEATIGIECAFMLDGFQDWQIDDRLECFQEVPE